MRCIPDGSIDLIACDPPYGTMKGLTTLRGAWKYESQDWDVQIDNKEMLEQCNRILRTNGALLLFSQEPYTSKLIIRAHLNLPFSYRLAWVKGTFANSLCCNKAPVNYMEDICVFFKKYDTLYSHPLRDYAKQTLGYIGLIIAQINKELEHLGAVHFFGFNGIQFGIPTEGTYNQLIDKYHINKMGGFLSYKEMKDIHTKYNDKFPHTFNLLNGQRYKSNLLKYKNDYENKHPTQKPLKLMDDLIRTYSNEGDTVLDFCLGSGTTGCAAKHLKRKFIGIELDPKYYKIACKRIEYIPYQESLNLKTDINSIRF